MDLTDFGVTVPDEEEKKEPVKETPPASVQNVKVGDWDVVEGAGLFKEHERYRCLSCGLEFIIDPDAPDVAETKIKDHCEKCTSLTGNAGYKKIKYEPKKRRGDGGAKGQKVL